jgi:chemotaxis protein CheX
MDIQPPDGAQPVPQELRDGLLAPFIEAACLTLREWAGTEAVVRAVWRAARPRTLGDVSAVLGLASDREGALVLSFPARIAAALAVRALAGTPLDEAKGEPAEDLICDCMGEIANVVAGQAKALLAGTPYRFTFSLPTVVNGAGHEVANNEDGESLFVAFDSDLGDFAMQLCLKG